MALGSGTEKTEQPTSRRLDEARNKGSVAFSPDLNSAVSLLFGFLFLNSLCVNAYNSLYKTMKLSLGNLVCKDFSTDYIVNIMTLYVYMVMKILSPFLGGLLLVGLAASYLQIGFMFNLGLLKPKLNKLNIVSGIKNLFSTKSSVKLIFSCWKLIVIGCVSFFYIRKEFNRIDIIDIIDISLSALLVLNVKLMYGLALRVSAALLTLAVLDLIYQKWQYKRNLRMTKEEVKEERKQMDGDPLIKSKIRSIQRQMAMKRMMSAIPKADVVVTNPSHYAVALKYDNTTMKAPTVVAKGADLIAKRIKQIAKKHKVPLVEDKPLAQTLYKTVEIGKEIPQKLYYAVAKVLSYVYQLKKRK
ncbi:Flagellar biosynthetic protein FlhB [Candidatus Brocadiaceae bacterium B188]|nr:flagellar biosynthesis protein FlhB [Candidatus Brocadia sapporoensis]MEB2309462.1 flagellar biosynthesis protein FlhB [Candidatus Brocadiaceae bacterium]RZV56715.1 MAG: flagellar biosynthesis protein FlhB [Candidatus Brocadia sp. BROELEC01]TWU54229.1 Flagellar biosynthetic protein FlhB [Candidatus Brocadiaceae bacterium B188]